jgi:hypothetical protein
MALEIGQVVGGIGLLPIQRGQAPDDTAAAESGLPVRVEQAPPLTGVGAKPLSGDALQTLQGVAESEEGQDAPDGELTEEEKEVVEKLKARDQEVRAHESAHAAAGGQYAGAPTFSYQQGPDGRRYAIGGEVSIDLSPGGTPEETARKADQIRAAALAPADPSGQDRAVAAAAAQMKAQALAEGAAQRREEAEAEKAEDEATRAEQAVASGQTTEIVGPKPPGAEPANDGAAPAGEGGDRRIAAAASAYSRTDDAVSRTSRTVSNALSLVA